MNSYLTFKKPTDTVMLPAYNKSKEMVIYDATSAMRAEESAELTIPENWSGDALAVYLSFQNEDNASVSKQYVRS